MNACHWRPANEERITQANRAELIARLARATQQYGLNGLSEPLEGVRLGHAPAPTEIGHRVSFPSFCVITQGSKEVLLGGKRYWYDASHYLIATTALPIASRIADASAESPYLSVMVLLDPTMISEVMIESGYGMPRNHTTQTAIDVSELDAGLLDVVVRLVRLLDTPNDAHCLAPLLKCFFFILSLQDFCPRRLRVICVKVGEHQLNAGFGRCCCKFAC